jgi:hypothetical protein
MDLTKTRFLWLHEPTAAMGHLHDIAGIGFDAIAVKFLDGRSPFQPNATRALLADAASMGLPVIPWIYARPGEPDAIAQAVENCLPKGCTDLIIDAEIEFEQCSDPSGEAEALVHAIAQATGHRVAIHLSSFWSPDLHPDFPFRAFLSHCAAVGGTWMPQSYFEGGSRTPQEILDSTLSEAGPVLASPAQQVVVTVNGTAFLPLLKAKGIAGYSVYCWDDDGDARVSASRIAWQAALCA